MIRFTSCYYFAMERGTWEPNLDIRHHISSAACPRCGSSNTKFCYYNNYSLTQPRYLCKGCRRYWTKGGSLRNVPIGGGCLKSRRGKSIRVSTDHAKGIEPRSSLISAASRTNNISTSTTSSPCIDLAAVYAKFVNDHQKLLPCNQIEPSSVHELLLVNPFLRNFHINHIISGDHHNLTHQQQAPNNSVDTSQLLFGDESGSMYLSGLNSSGEVITAHGNSNFTSSSTFISPMTNNITLPGEDLAVSETLSWLISSDGIVSNVDMAGRNSELLNSELNNLEDMFRF